MSTNKYYSKVLEFEELHESNGDDWDFFLSKRKSKEQAIDSLGTLNHKPDFSSDLFEKSFENFRRIRAMKKDFAIQSISRLGKDWQTKIFKGKEGSFGQRSENVLIYSGKEGNGDSFSKPNFNELFWNDFNFKSEDMNDLLFKKHVEVQNLIDMKNNSTWLKNKRGIAKKYDDKKLIEFYEENKGKKENSNLIDYTKTDLSFLFKRSVRSFEESEKWESDAGNVISFTKSKIYEDNFSHYLTESRINIKSIITAALSSRSRVKLEYYRIGLESNEWGWLEEDLGKKAYNAFKNRSNMMSREFFLDEVESKVKSGFYTTIKFRVYHDEMMVMVLDEVCHYCSNFFDVDELPDQFVTLNDSLQFYQFMNNVIGQDLCLRNCKYEDWNLDTSRKPLIRYISENIIYLKKNYDEGNIRKNGRTFIHFRENPIQNLDLKTCNFMKDKVGEDCFHKILEFISPCCSEEKYHYGWSNTSKGRTVTTKDCKLHISKKSELVTYCDLPLYSADVCSKVLSIGIRKCESAIMYPTMSSGKMNKLFDLKVKRYELDLIRRVNDYLNRRPDSENKMKECHVKKILMLKDDESYEGLNETPRFYKKKTKKDNSMESFLENNPRANLLRNVKEKKKKKKKKRVESKKKTVDLGQKNEKRKKTIEFLNINLGKKSPESDFDANFQKEISIINLKVGGKPSRDTRTKKDIVSDLEERLIKLENYRINQQTMVNVLGYSIPLRRLIGRKKNKNIRRNQKIRYSNEKDRIERIKENLMQIEETGKNISRIKEENKFFKNDSVSYLKKSVKMKKEMADYESVYSDAIHEIKQLTEQKKLLIGKGKRKKKKEKIREMNSGVKRELTSIKSVLEEKRKMVKSLKRAIKYIKLFSSKKTSLNSKEEKILLATIVGKNKNIKEFKSELEMNEEEYYQDRMEKINDLELKMLNKTTYKKYNLEKERLRIEKDIFGMDSEDY